MVVALSLTMYTIVSSFILVVRAREQVELLIAISAGLAQLGARQIGNGPILLWVIPPALELQSAHLQLNTRDPITIPWGLMACAQLNGRAHLWHAPNFLCDCHARLDIWVEPDARRSLSQVAIECLDATANCFHAVSSFSSKNCKHNGVCVGQRVSGSGTAVVQHGGGAVKEKNTAERPVAVWIDSSL